MDDRARGTFWLHEEMFIQAALLSKQSTKENPDFKPRLLEKLQPCRDLSP
jgi:hypothetical protein